MHTITEETERALEEHLRTTHMFADEREALAGALAEVRKARAAGGRCVTIRWNGSEPVTVRIA